MRHSVIAVLAMLAVLSGSIMSAAAASPIYLCLSEKAGAAKSGGLEGKCPAATAKVKYARVALPADEAQQQALLSILPYIKFVASGVSGKPTVQFSGVNVQVVSGAGKTNAPVNGEGNLVLGYDEHTSEQEQTGSNNLVIGEEGTFTSFGGILAGQQNVIAAPFASVTAGIRNKATGELAAVTGGANNHASGPVAAISGGVENEATGDGAAVSGGWFGLAQTTGSAVSGGYLGHALDNFASVTGGYGNYASSVYAAVSGGEFNHANSIAGSISGGSANLTNGRASWVGGGQENHALNNYASIFGGQQLVATAEWESIP